jgi:hypothetical protein
MPQTCTRPIVVMLLLGWHVMHDAAPLQAQAPSRQQQYEEAIRAARRTEILGYILAGVAIVLAIAAIPAGIYLDRKKKARKAAGSAPVHRDDRAGSKTSGP